MANITWNKGENASQIYYDAYVGDDYLCVFMNKWQPGIWMGMQRYKMIHDKTFNDQQRKRQKLRKDSPIDELTRTAILCHSTPEYMIKKVEHCYRHNKMEVCR